MNVYQKVLLKLYDATGGRETKAVYLRDIVKDLGFLPSYNDIFSQMSSDGWITETQRSDEVNITPWGIRAAKKLNSGENKDSKELELAVKRVGSAARDVAISVDELSSDASAEKIDEIEKAIAKIQATLKDLRKLV